MKQWKGHIGAVVWAAWIVLTVTQIPLSFFLYNQAGSNALRVIAWILWVATCLFGWLPMLILRAKGGVPKGEDYTNTTVLVDSGIYGIVRHPQYLSFLLLNLFFILLVQHPVMTVVGLVAMLLAYVIACMADRVNIEKFQAYEAYMQQVPRVNAVAGIIRLIQRKNSG